MYILCYLFPEMHNECKVSTLLIFYLSFTLIFSLKIGRGSSALFCIVYYWHSLTLLPEIIVRLIFYEIIKPLGNGARQKHETTMSIVYRLSWILWCIDLAQCCAKLLISISNLQFLTPCNLFKFYLLLIALHHLNTKHSIV